MQEKSNSWFLCLRTRDIKENNTNSLASGAIHLANHMRKDGVQVDEEILFSSLVSGFGRVGATFKGKIVNFEFDKNCALLDVAYNGKSLPLEANDAKPLKNKKNKCHCDIMLLMSGGCRCGGE